MQAMLLMSKIEIEGLEQRTNQRSRRSCFSSAPSTWPEMTPAGELSISVSPVRLMGDRSE
jgi:hypothetical protein